MDEGSSKLTSRESVLDRRRTLPRKALRLAIALFLSAAASSSFAGVTKLYVSNSQGDDITVINLATRQSGRGHPCGQAEFMACALQPTDEDFSPLWSQKII